MFKRMKKSFVKAFDSADHDNLFGIAKWAADAGKEIGGLKSEPSKVGIAREYELLLANTSMGEDISGSNLKRGQELADWICKSLKLPEQVLSQEVILNNE